MKTRNLIAAVLLLTAGAYLPAQKQVRVTNSRELVQAPASDRTVLLSPGEYLVSEVAQVGNPAVSWDKAFDVVLEGLTLGHTEQGYCAGGVVGIDAVDSSGITIRATTTRVRDVRLEQVVISGNGSYPLMSLDSARGVVPCRIERNTGDWLLQIDGDSGDIALPGSEIRFNETGSLLYDRSLVPDLSQTRIVDNAFDTNLEDDDGAYDGEYEEERG